MGDIKEVRGKINGIIAGILIFAEPFQKLL